MLFGFIEKNYACILKSKLIKQKCFIVGDDAVIRLKSASVKWKFKKSLFICSLFFCAPSSVKDAIDHISLQLPIIYSNVVLFTDIPLNNCSAIHLHKIAT